MTPMFDDLDKELREALAPELLPPAGFTDRVMARVARTPQQKKAPAHYRRWLVSAAACLVVAAALIPLVRGGRSDGSDALPDSAGLLPSMQSAPSPAAGDGQTAGDSALRKEAQESCTAAEDAAGDSGAAAQDNGADGTGLMMSSAPSSMDDALTDAADALSEQGYTLTVTARRDDAVQAELTAADGADGDDRLLTDAMSAAGFTAADGWYIYETSEEETNP